MTSEGENWPDVEGAMRDFLRADTGLVALVGNRVFFGAPREPTYPMILITRVGGGQARGEAPIDNALLQLDVLGKLASEPGGGKGPVTTAALALQKAVSRIKNGTKLVSNVTAWDAQIVSSFYSPDPITDRPRHIITVMVPALATAV